VSYEISYSILKYKHSEFLGEVLNVGVIFIVPQLNIIEFHYPKKIHRLVKAYPTLNEDVIKNYLKSFQKKAKSFNKYLDKYSFDLNDLLFDHLIVEDSSSLQFEKFRSAIIFDDFNKSRDKYLELILGPYESPTISTIHKCTDSDIVNSIKESVISLDPNKKELLKFDKKRILRSKLVSFKSDFYWFHNGTHYVKALSFDLSNETNIIDKSLLINGQLRHLEKSKLKDSKIDLIVRKPSDDKLLDAFFEAKSILADSQIDKEIILNESAIEYSRSIISIIG
jgi:hypothetical protein